MEHKSTLPAVKMKIRELTGSALEYAVAKALGWDDYDLIQSAYPGFNTFKGKPDFILLSQCKATVDGTLGVSIMEREFVETTLIPAGTSDTKAQDGDVWYATVALPDADMIECTGPTILVAGMRCFGIKQLGEEIDVPVELLKPMYS